MSETTFRLSGILLSLGALLLGIAVVQISFKPVISQPFLPGVSLLILLSAILLLLSLPAMYARQAHAAGWLGLTGHILLQSGVVLLVILAAPSLIFPSLRLATGENRIVFILGIAFTLGLLLTGLATIQANVFPRGAGILLLTAMAGFFFNFFIAEFLPPVVGQIGSAIFGILLAAAFCWIGVALWIGKFGAVTGNILSNL